MTADIVAILSPERRARMEEWLAALKSGKYKHGTGRLRNATDDSYCCLGVMLDLYDSRLWNFHHGAFFYDLELLNYTYPDTLFAEEFGLRDKTGKLLGRDHNLILFFIPQKYGGSPLVSLSSVNDRMDSFDAVIAILECYLENQNVSTITLTITNGVCTAVGV